MKKAAAMTGTSVMQLPLGAFGVMLHDYSFFYDSAGNLDIGGDRSQGSDGGKRGRKKRRRKLPSDWLKLNDDEDLQAREATEQEGSSWWRDLHFYGMIASGTLWCVHHGRIPVVNIRLPIRAWFDPRKCKFRRIKH